MAEAIGTAIIAAVATEATATALAATAIPSIIGSITITAVATGANLLIGSLNQPKQRNEAQQSVLNQAMGARVGIYGTTKVGGSRAFFDTRNGNLYQIILLASHQIDGIAQYWIGDKVMTTSLGENGGTVQNPPITGKIGWEPHLGAPDQAASPLMLNDWPNLWTANHRLRGIAYVLVVFLGVKKEQQQQIYPQSYATPLSFTVRGKRVWSLSPDQNPDDPTAWAYTQTPTRCIVDYLRAGDGMRFPLSRLDLPSFRDHAALCDEPVARANASLEPRYRIGGTYQFTEAPKTVLARMCDTCDATLVQRASGLIGIRGGRYTAPLVNIPSRNIRTASLSQGNDRLDAYNRLSVSYSDPDNLYQPTELQAYNDTASQAQVGVVDQTKDLVMVPSWTQAARLAKIQFYRDNPAWKGSLGTDLAALNALGEQVVRATFDPLPEIGPLLDENVEVVGFSTAPTLSGCSLTIASLPATAYTWNPAVEEPPRPAMPASATSANTVAAPQNVVVSPSRRALGNGTTGVWAVLSWNATTRTDAVPQAQYKLTADDDTAYQAMTLRGDGISAEAGPLTDGQTYAFRVRYVGGSTPSDWTGSVTLRASSDPNPPLTPYNFTATPKGGGVVTLGWTNGNSQNYEGTTVYAAAGDGATFAQAQAIDDRPGAPNQANAPTYGSQPPGPVRYWLVGYNGSGARTDPVGPVGATVT